MVEQVKEGNYQGRFDFIGHMVETKGCFNACNGRTYVILRFFAVILFPGNNFFLLFLFFNTISDLKGNLIEEVEDFCKGKGCRFSVEVL